MAASLPATSVDTVASPRTTRAGTGPAMSPTPPLTAPAPGERSICPDSRLILLSAMLLIPALGIGIALPEFRSPTVAVIVGLALVAGVDAWRGLHRVLPLGACIPGSPRLGIGRPALVAILLSGLPRAGARLRVGIAWPGSQIDAVDTLEVSVPTEATHARLDWPCRALQRGEINIAACHLELASPARLWLVRKRVPLGATLRVYPNLLRERRRLAALFLPRAGAGWRPQRTLGQGREFEQLRDYVPGDGSEDIHWKATAKRGNPVTKLFQLERTQEIYVVIDASRLAARRIARDTHSSPASAPDPSAQPAPQESDSELELRLNAGLILGLAAQRQSDRFGFIAFGERVSTFLRASQGPRHFARCQDALHGLQPQARNPDFAELFTTIRTRLRRRALLVFFTALDDPLLAEEFERGVRLVARQHLILVHQIAPADARPILHGDPPASLRDVGRGLAGHARWTTLRGTAARLQRLGVHFTLLTADQLATESVSRYLDVKRRQIL